MPGEGISSGTVRDVATMLIGYARCSTDTQDLTAQHDGLTALGVKGPTGSMSITARPDETGTDPDCAKPSPPAAPVTPSWSPSSTAWPAPFPTPATLSRSSPPPKRNSTSAGPCKVGKT